MNPVYITALAGVAGILLGTLGRGLVETLAERRREHAAGRVAAAAIRAELERNQRVLNIILTTSADKPKLWWPAGHGPRSDQWEKHGANLLTGYPRTPATGLDQAYAATSGLAEQADYAYERVAEAERRVVYLDEGGKVVPHPTESEGVAYRRELAEATEKADRARAELQLDTRQVADAKTAKTLISQALSDLPKPSKSKAPAKGRALGAADVLAAPLIVIAVLAAVIAIAAVLYDTYTISSGEVAAALRKARGAELVSCSGEKDVANVYDCELTFVANPKACQLSARAEPSGARVLIAAVATPPVPPATPSCRAEIITKDTLHLANKAFLSQMTSEATNGTSEAEKRGLLAWAKTHISQWVTGKVGK